MWHCGHVRMGSILTSRKFQTKLYAHQCKYLFYIFIRSSSYLSIFNFHKYSSYHRCQEGDEDKKTPILFSSECKLSKWSKPMKISNSGRKVSRDTSQLLPGLRQYKCKFPVNKTEIDESFCAMLKKVTKLSFFEDLFVKHFCLKYK